MSDLPYIDATMEVKIAGQDSTGANVNYVGADANGNMTTKDAADGTTGAAVPSTAIQVGGSDGTNLRALKVSTTGVVSVDGSAVTQPVSGTVTANQGTANSLGNAWSMKITDATNGPAAVKAASTAAVATDPALVVAISPNNPLTTSPTDATATGNITTQNLNPNSGIATAASTVTFASALAGMSDVTIQVSGTYTGALTPQISIDGSGNWVAISAITNVNTGVQSATIASAATGIWQGKIPAASKFRISANAAVTGTATVSIQAGNGSGYNTIDTPLPTGSNTIGAVTGSGTFTVSGTVTANAGTNLNTSALALESGGNLATIVTNTNNLSLAQASTTSGQKGNLVLGATTTSAPSYSTAQSNPLSLDTSGNLRVTGSVTTSGTTAVAGDVASGSSDSGNPVKIGAVAHTAAPTAVTDGQRVNLIADKVGRLVVVPGQVRDLVVQQTTTISNTTTETTFITAVASTFLDISSLVITNQSVIPLTITIKDATSGTTRANFDLNANGGMVFNPTIPWKQATVNNNWTATLSVNNAVVNIFAIAVKNT